MWTRWIATNARRWARSRKSLVKGRRNTLSAVVARIRITPYHTRDNRIDGLGPTFVDITAAKTLEATLREKQV
jgi:hypothetical protein